MKMEKDILYRYFEGIATEEEKNSIHQWIEESSDNRKLFIRERIRFDATLLMDEKAIATSPKHIRLSQWMINTIKIAASVLVLIGCLHFFELYHQDKQSKKTQMVYVPAGNRSKLLLPDGTTIWLNSNTRLRYPLTFADGKREIMLDGEAYLKVAKSKEPFIVKTNKYNVQVLGTTFSVTAYAADSVFQTSLYEGRIKVFDNNKASVYLSPGETAYSQGGSLYVTNTKDSDEYRWTDGLICVTDKQFSEIMQIFERTFDVQIVMNDSLLSKLRYNGKFRILDGVEHALKVLQNDYPFVYRRNIDDNVIYIEIKK